MNPATLKLIGTALEILGTFFLAVEAIKLHNLRELHQRILIVTMRFHPIAKVLKAKAGRTEMSGTYVGILGLLGAVLVYGLLSLRGISLSYTWAWYRSFVPGPLAVDLLVALPTALVLFIVLSLFGSFFIQIVTFPLLVAIVLLEQIEKYTASGVVGILGFAFFLAGATLKAYLDWIGG